MAITEIAPLDTGRAQTSECFKVVEELDPGRWGSRYGEYDRDLQMQKLDDLREVLSTVSSSPGDIEADYIATASFIEGAFNLFEGKATEPHDGSFAFVVPTRIERDNPDYAEEAVEHFPLLKHVDPETRQRMLVGMCPFIIDRYGVDEQGRRGSMIFTPLFGDMIADEPERALDIAKSVINDTALFAKERLGVSVIGLGAILPRLTNMGKDITVEGLHTTTGHGGTVHLIAETMKSATERGLVPNDGKIGIIGAGAIGRASADVILGRGYADDIMISDRPDEVGQTRLEEVVSDLTSRYPNARVIGAVDNTHVVSEREAIISAVTTSFDLDEGGWPFVDFEGKFILDDSQPGCFNPSQVGLRGATLAWVMGRDNTADGLVSLSSFEYGSTGPASLSDVWGCEAEAFAVSRTGEYDAAIDAVVTPDSAARIGELLFRSEIGPARLQRMGVYL